MGKIAEVRKLYHEVINDITLSEEKWLNFLDCSSWQFKYDFMDKVLIYAQNPNAKACAEMETWNNRIRPKRWVNENADCIFVVSKDENSKYPFRLVFDVANTHNYLGTEYKLWEVKPEYEKAIIETLDTTYGAENESKDLQTAIISNSYNLVMDNIQDYYDTIINLRKDSLLDNYENQDIYNNLVATVWTSVAYMMLQRCGFNAREIIGEQEVSFVKVFKDENIITVLGNAVSDIAESGIREIYKTVKNLQIEEKNKNRTFVKKEKLIYSNNIEKQKGGIENGENRVHESGRLQYSKSSARKREDSKWKIRQNEIKLSKETQQKSIYDIIYEEKFSRTSKPNSDRIYEDDKSDSGKISHAGWTNGRNENERSTKMDRTNEQLQVNSGRASNERTNLQLNNYNPNIWQDTNEISKFYDDETIDIIISNAPNIIKNEDMLEQNLRFNTDENRKENIINILGNAFTEYEINNERYGYKTYDNGLYLWKGDYLHRTEECFIEWNVIIEYFVNRSLQQEVIDFAKENLITEEQQKGKVAEADNASVFSFTQEMIDNVLIDGNHVENGKFRIYEFLTRGLSVKENMDFLKQEYGIGGRSSDINGVSEDHDTKGIRLYVGFKDDRPEMLLSWKQVEKRIRELIADDRYFSNLEKDEYNDWLDVNGIETRVSKASQIKDEDYKIAERLHNYMMNYDIVSYQNNFSLESTVEQNIELLKADINDESNIKEYIDFLKNSYEDLDFDDEISIEARSLIEELEKRLPGYELHSGDTVYIGTQEYEISSINENNVILIDPTFPLLSKELNRRVFDDRIKDNPFNERLRTRKSKRNNTIDDIQEKEDIVLQQDNIEKIEKGTILEKSYKVGDVVYLESDRRFRIEKIDIDSNRIHLVDLEINYPIFRDESLSVFERLYFENNRNRTNIEELKPKIEKKRRNKIEYFDLHPEIPLENRNNYKITNNDLGIGSQKEKYQRNIEAIKILKKCEDENRYATKEEQEILSQYVGWGGLQDAFDSRKDNWHKEYEELKSLLTEKEYREAKESTLTAFYTPPIVINTIYKALENMGLERGNILEPSCRSGQLYGNVTRYFKSM